MIDALVPTNYALAPEPISATSLGARLANVTANVANYLVVRPLANLYLEGPAVLGFWGGVSMEDICAQLTSTNANFWTSSDANTRECEAHVERHFNSWMVLTTTAAYFCVAAVTTHSLLCRRRPGPAQVIYLQNGGRQEPKT